MLFAGNGQSKQHTAAAVAANIALAAIESGDRVGVVTFDSEIRQHRRPAKGRAHALQIVADCLEPCRRRQPASIATTLRELPQHARKHGIIFVISDFLDHDPDLVSALRLASRRSELIGVRIYDPGETDLPGGIFPVQDPESRLYRLTSGRSRRAYKNAYTQHCADLTHAFQAAQAPLLTCATTEDPSLMLQGFYQRGRR
jgi:uncharacterized protein (DUF58 family)